MSNASNSLADGPHGLFMPGGDELSNEIRQTEREAAAARGAVAEAERKLRHLNQKKREAKEALTASLAEQGTLLGVAREA